MPLLLTAALVASAASLPTCSWDHPGAGPYMGTIDAAVDRYTDIAQPVREALKARMAKHQYDEMVAIRRDSITGKSRYGSDLRQMHFGQGQVCGTVTRSRWSDSAVERGLVYCESGHCLVVPTVCRNVSRVTRLGPDEGTPGREQGTQSGTAAAPGSTVPNLGAGGEPATELSFDAPGAGGSFADPAGPTTALGGVSLAQGGGGVGGGVGGPLPGLGAGPGSGGNGGASGTVPGNPLNNSPEGPREGGGPPLPLDPPGVAIGGGGGGVDPGPVSPVPEPHSVVLTSVGLLGLLAALRRRQRRNDRVDLS